MGSLCAPGGLSLRVLCPLRLGSLPVALFQPPTAPSHSALHRHNPPWRLVPGTPRTVGTPQLSLAPLLFPGWATRERPQRRPGAIACPGSDPDPAWLLQAGGRGGEASSPRPAGRASRSPAKASREVSRPSPGHCHAGAAFHRGQEPRADDTAPPSRGAEMSPEHHPLDGCLGGRRGFWKKNKHSQAEGSGWQMLAGDRGRPEQAAGCSPLNRVPHGTGPGRARALPAGSGPEPGQRKCPRQDATS